VGACGFDIDFLLIEASREEFLSEFLMGRRFLFGFRIEGLDTGQEGFKDPSNGAFFGCGLDLFEFNLPRHLDCGIDKIPDD